MYSERLIDHFMNPRGVGALDDANGIGMIGDPNCGDFLCMFLKVDDMVIKDITFLCRGCPASIASASATVEMMKDKTLEDAILLEPADIVDYLNGMPEEKQHCSNLGVGALHYAVADYLGLLKNNDEANIKQENN